MRIEARFADFCRVQCVIVVCATLLGCQKVGFVDVSVPRPEVTVPPTPSAQPVSPEPEPPAVPVPQAVKVIPQALQVGILRFEADSWFKSCFWLTIDGEHSDSTFLGCNKGAQLLGQNITVEIPQTDTSEGSHSKCRMLGFRAEVYRNTENCDRPGSCSSETYAAQPSHVQSTSPVQGRSAFIVQIQGKTASMDARIAFVGSFLNQHLEWVRTPMDAKVHHTRVFFEDQGEEVLQAAFGLGASPSKLGVDYNDVIFDLSVSQGLNLGIQGTPVACGSSFPPP